MNTKTAINKAIEGGYKWRGEDIKEYSIDNPLDITLRKKQNGEEWREIINQYEALLDPSFWQALEKSMRWGDYAPYDLPKTSPLGYDEIDLCKMQQRISETL